MLLVDWIAPIKLPLPLGICPPHLITGSLGPQRHTSPNDILIGSADLAQLAAVPNEYTHRTRDIGNNRPHLMPCIAMPLGSSIISIIIIIIKSIYIPQVRKGHKCAMSAEMAVWLRNCLCLYSYLLLLLLHTFNGLCPGLPR